MQCRRAKLIEINKDNEHKETADWICDDSKEIELSFDLFALMMIVMVMINPLSDCFPVVRLRPSLLRVEQVIESLYAFASH